MWHEMKLILLIDCAAGTRYASVVNMHAASRIGFISCYISAKYDKGTSRPKLFGTFVLPL